MHHLQHVDSENVSLDFGNKNRSNYLLTCTGEMDNEVHKSNLYSEKYFGDDNDFKFLRRKARLSSRKLFFSHENSKERPVSKELHDQTAMDGCSHRRSYIDKRRISLYADEKLTGVNQVSFPVKYSGHPEMVSRAAKSLQMHQSEPDHETYASYISDHGHKNRRRRYSKKTFNILHKDQLDKDGDQNNRSNDIGTEPLCGMKAKRATNKEDNSSHTSTSSRYWSTKEDEDMPNENEKEKVLYFSNKVEPNSFSNNKSRKKLVRYRNLVDKNSKLLNKPSRHRSCGSDDERTYFKVGSQGRLKASNALSNHRVSKRSHRSSLRETPCYIESTYNQRQNEPKLGNRWNSWRERQSNARSSNRNERDECYSNYSEFRKKSETPVPLTAEDILSRPPWTCTKWATDVFTDGMKESSVSKWAYEVYSDTCLRATSEDLSAKSHSKTHSGENEDPWFMEASNETCQEPESERSDYYKNDSCGNNFTFQTPDFSQDMAESSAVCPGRHKPRLVPHLMANYSPFNYEQMAPECSNQPKEICRWYFQPENCYENLDMINKKINNFVHYIPVNITRMGAPFEIITINTNGKQEEACSIQQKETEACISDKRAGINESEGAQIQSSGNKDENGKDENGKDENGNDDRKINSTISDPISSQSESNIDEKLIRTVHAIKEDIQGVFDRLNSLETHSDPTVIKPVLLIQENLLGALDQAKAAEGKDTVSKVNSAAEIVKGAITKLAEISTAFMSDRIEEEEDCSNLSYNLYKAGKDKYNTGIETNGCDYDISVYSIDCKKQRSKNVPQTLNQCCMEVNDTPTWAANSGRERKYSQEDIYLMLKENSKIKQTSRGISQQALADNNDNERSSTESSECITLSDNKINPLTTGSRLCQNSNKNFLVQQDTESQPPITLNGRENDVIHDPQPVIDDILSPKRRIRKKRNGSLSKKIKEKLLELFEHPLKLYGESNEKPSKNIPGNNKIEQSLNDKKCIENSQTNKYNNTSMKEQPRSTAEILPKTILKKDVSNRRETKSSESKTSSVISLSSTVGPANELWNLLSTPRLIHNTAPVQASTSETSGDDKAEPICRRKCLLKKKSEKRTKRTRQHPITTRDVKIVYKLKSKTSMSQSETSLLNSITLSESDNETITLPADKSKESLRLSQKGSCGVSREKNENQAHVNKAKRSSKYMDRKKASIKNVESFDKKIKAINEMKSSQSTPCPIKDAQRSTLANYPINDPLRSNNNYCLTKDTHNSHRKNYTQSAEKHTFQIKEGQRSVKNSYPIKDAQSSDTNSYPIKDVQSSAKNSYPIKDAQSSDTNSYPIKDVQSSVKNSYPIKDAQSPDTNIYPNKDVKYSVKNSYPIKDAQSPDTNIYPNKDVKYSVKNSYPIKDTQSPDTNIYPNKDVKYSVKNSYPIKDAQSPDTNIYPNKDVKYSVKNSYPIKDAQSPDTNIYPNKDVKYSVKNSYPIEDTQSPDTNIYPNKDVKYSVKNSYPIKDTLSPDTNIYPNKDLKYSVKNSYPIKDTQSPDTNIYPNKDVKYSVKNSYPIKDAQSSDTNSYPVKDVQRSGENKHVIKKSQSFVKNNTFVKDSQSSGLSPGSSVSPIRHFTERSRFHIKGRKRGRQRIAQRMDRDIMKEKETSDTCSISSPESSSTKISDLTENSGIQKSYRKLDTSTALIDKSESKHIKGLWSDKDKMNIKTSTNTQTTQRKFSPEKPSNESETSSQSLERNEEIKYFLGKEIQSITPGKSYIKRSSKIQSNQNATPLSIDHETQTPKIEHKDTNSSDKELSGMISASELNIAIMKLYEEINKLRIQLEASTEEMFTRNSPPRRNLPIFLEVSAGKNDYGKQEITPNMCDRYTPLVTSNSREDFDNDSISDCYYGPAMVTPKVLENNRERTSSPEATTNSSLSASRSCCVYRKYSNENVKFHVEKDISDTVRPLSFVENVDPNLSELKTRVNYPENKQILSGYRSVDEEGRDSNEYWSEHGKPVIAQCELQFNDAEFGQNDNDCLNDENDDQSVADFDYQYEIDTADERSAQEYIFNNVPIQPGAIKAYTSTIFPTAALESKQSAAQNNPLAISQYKVSHKSLACSTEDGISDITKGNNSRGAVKCKIEPSQPDLWPQRFVYTEKVMPSKKGSIYNAVVKGLEESQQQKDADAVGKDRKEDGITEQLNYSNFKNTAVFGTFNECNIEGYAKVNKNDLQSAQNTKSNESQTDPSLSASPSLSCNDQYYFTSQPKNQERQSPNEKPTSHYTPFQMSTMPIWSETEESPVKKEEDYIPQSHVPRIVQCVKDLIFGSAKAERKHSYFDYPSIHARLRSTSKMKNSNNHDQKCLDPLGLASNVDGEQNYSNGYVTYLSDNRHGKYNCPNDAPKIENTPELQKCSLKTPGLNDMPRSRSPLSKFHAASNNNDRSPCYSERLSTEREGSNCCVGEQDLNVISQSSETHSLVQSDSSQYSPLVRNSEKTDTVIRHYSDAINLNGIRYLATHDASHSNVSTNNKPRSESILSNLHDLDRRDNRSFEEVYRCSYRDFSLNSETTCLEELDEDTRPSSRVSDDSEEWNGQGTSLPVDKSDENENCDAASLESTLHHSKNYYVENCSFRHKKRDNSLSCAFRVDEIEKSDTVGDLIVEHRSQKCDVSGNIFPSDNYSSHDVERAEVNTAKRMFVESLAPVNELNEGTDILGKKPVKINSDFFREDEESFINISQNTDPIRYDNKDSDCDKDFELSNFEDEIYVDEERQEKEKTNIEDHDERKNSVEECDNSSYFENYNSIKISSRNTSLDEDEIESWYKMTDDESNTQ